MSNYNLVKKVFEEDFVVGEVYQDIVNGLLEPILLEFVSKDEKSCYFKLISNYNKWYWADDNGLIGFPRSKLYMFKQVENQELDSCSMILNEIVGFPI